MGDIIGLKSGSPGMTVEDIIDLGNDKHRVLCTYYNYNSSKLCRELFVSEALEKVEE